CTLVWGELVILPFMVYLQSTPGTTSESTKMWSRLFSSSMSRGLLDLERGPRVSIKSLRRIIGSCLVQHPETRGLITSRYLLPTVFTRIALNSSKSTSCTTITPSFLRSIDTSEQVSLFG